MKRKFTFLMAAVALLCFMLPPMTGWGQTRNTQTVSYGWETSDDTEPWTISDAIVATSGEGNTGTFAGKINTNSTTVQFNEKVYVTSFSYAFKRTSNNNNYSVYIETSTDGSNWSIKDTQAMNTFTNGSYKTVTKEFDGTQELYVRFRCNNTTAIRYVDDVTITYATSAVQLDPCDLMLTNASTSIVFDLYNNSDAYVINYTTSSTGEVTVADSDYIATVVDQTNKTITVTPVAVTNGAKVVTVNQAADDNYAAGSKTFTINITDSTPFAGGDVTFDATVDKDLGNVEAGEGSITKLGVTFACDNGILGNGSEYRMYKNSVTTFSVSEGTITQIVFTGTSSNPASGFASQTGWTTEGNNGTWTGSDQVVSFTASGAQVRATQIVVIVDLGGTPTPSITLSSYSVNATADETDGTLTLTYSNVETSAGVEIIWCNETGAALSDQTAYQDWLLADFATGNINTIEYTIEPNTGVARTAYFKVYGIDGDANDVYSDLVTVTQAAYVAPPTPSNWVLTSFADLTPADVFVIVGDNGDTYALPSTTTSSAPTASSITVNTSTTPYTLENSPDASLQWNLIITKDGYVFYPYQATGNWLNCTNSNNGVRVGNTTTNAKHFTMDESGYLTTTETSEQRYLGIYNSQDWRTYTSPTATNIKDQTFSFYKKVSDDVTYTKKNIAAYTGTNDNYYLIASPVASVTPSSANGFFTTDYDLYAFDESEQGAEWRNYETNTFNLVSGKGYLYASSSNTELTFTGQPYNGNGLVELAYTDGKTFAGWNLIGNPFGTTATVDKPNYRLTENGSALNTKAYTESTPVSAMEGLFVQATATSQTATFTQQTRGEKSNAIAQANLTVNQNGSIIDNAIVRFDGGQTLDKFQLRENSTRVYFTEDGHDYAIVNAEAQGELPVNFKAAENGTYTINVATENLDVDYLHLIDNLTGTDVDLLATPSYTFESRKNDYASRFRLRFSANDSNNSVSDEFAFVSNGDIVIMNEGEATLQVIDMLGRTVSTQAVDGNARIDKMNANGVYVLRLIDGNEVKTQKIVIE